MTDFVGQRRTRARRILLSLTTILSTGLAVPALAQVPPPVRPSVDGNGVDLFTGQVSVDGPALSIGSAERGMSYYQLYRSGGWTNNLTATIAISGSTVTVTFGGTSDRFTQSGSTYTTTEGRGAMLTRSGSTYTYTAGNGTAAHFNTSVSGFYPRYSTAAQVTDITSPNGERLNYLYESVAYCSASKFTADGLMCTSHNTAYRLAYVDNRYGFRAAYNYDELTVDPDDPSTGPFYLEGWRSPRGVTLINRATNASVSGPGYTNNAGQAASFGIGPSGMTSVARPGSSSADMTFGYAAGRVSSVTTAAGTIGYAASDSGAVRTVTVRTLRLRRRTLRLRRRTTRSTSPPSA